jgi:3-methylfumaryl-CoA hydratase
VPVENEVKVDVDVVTEASSRAMHGLFDAPGDPPRMGDPLPPLWHWMALLPRLARREMGEDGHPRRDSVIRGDEFSRRMFAGARLSFLGVAHVGETLIRSSWLKSVERKIGRSGELLFVTVAAEIATESTLLISEEQDIVYRRAEGTFTALPREAIAADADWPLRIELPTDPITLFRHSALTYNAHRIHYDREYATKVEGYPGLVVQGPFQAMGLAEVARRHVPDRSIESLTIRAVRPAFDGQNLNLIGQPQPGGLVLASIDSSSSVTMSGQITWKDDVGRRSDET